jgi:hypothetical protein
MDLNDFAIDPAQYEEGREIPLGDGCSVTIRAAGSKRGAKVRDRLMKNYLGWREIPDDVMARINAEWLAQGLIGRFEGFTDKGSPLSFELTKAEDQQRLAHLLAQPRFKALRSRLLSIAMDESGFSAASETAAAEN